MEEIRKNMEEKTPLARGWPSGLASETSLLAVVDGPLVRRHRDLGRRGSSRARPERLPHGVAHRVGRQRVLLLL